MTNSNYPGDQQNDPTSNQEIYKDLSILNQPAGGLEFVNTKDDEILSLFYKNGSVLRFTKYSFDQFHKLDKREHIMGNSRLQINGNKIDMIDRSKEEIILGDSYEKVGDIDKELPYQEQYKKLIRPIHDIKRRFDIQRTNLENNIDQAPGQSQSGSFAPCPVENINGTFIITTQGTEYTPATKEAGNSTIAEFTDPSVSYQSVPTTGEYCATCNATHLSPSSQDGSWAPDLSKDTITQERINLQKQLFDVEKKMGRSDQPDSGTRIEVIAKDLVQTIGLSFNDLESFRRDSHGKLVPNGVKIDPLGSSIQIQYTDSPLVEQVSVDRLPGGGYDLTCGDHLNVVVGSNGINLKTTGPIERFASTVKETAEDIQFHSRGEIGLAAQRIDLNADVISIRPNKVSKEIHGSAVVPEQQLLIDGNLQVANNAIIRGGLHVEGQVTLQHVVAPLEIQQTYESFEWGEQSPCSLDSTAAEACGSSPPPKSPVYADILAGCTIGWNRDDLYLEGECSDGASCITFVPKHTIFIESILAPNAVQVHPHFHNFPSIPMKLMGNNTNIQTTVNGNQYSGTLDANSAVRAIGASNNFIPPVQPLPVMNAQTQYTIVEKFDGICNPASLSEGSWQTTNTLDQLPSGEGPRSALYTADQVNQLIASLDAKYEQRYAELSKSLSNINQK